MSSSSVVDVGLLVLRGGEKMIHQKLRQLLRIAMPKVRHKLYVTIDGAKGIKELLPAIYLSASSIEEVKSVDLSVLLDRRTLPIVDRIFYDEVINIFFFYHT